MSKLSNPSGNTPAELYNRGIECLSRQSWEEAIATFRELIQIEPEYKDAWQRLEEAQEEVRKFEDLEFLYQVSRIQLEKKRWEAAIACMKRIADSGEEYKDVAALLVEAETQLKLQTLYANAEARMEQENWEEAVKVLEEILSIYPDYRDAYDRLQWVRQKCMLQDLYEQAMHHLEEERWRQAISSFAQLLSMSPDYSSAAGLLEEARKQQEIADLYSAAVGFQETGRLEEAITEFREITQRFGDYKDAADRLAQTCRQQELRERSELVTAYAVAHIRDHCEGQPLYVGEKYCLCTGILHKYTADSVSRPIELPDTAIVQVDVTVHAQDMEVYPNWLQRLLFYRDRDAGLIEFHLKPRNPGQKLIRIDFYHERHWLQSLEIKVSVLRTNGEEK